MNILIQYCDGRSVAELAKSTVENGHRLNERVIQYILYESLKVSRMYPT